MSLFLLFCAIFLAFWGLYELVGYGVEQLDAWLERRRRDAKQRVDEALADVHERLVDARAADMITDLEEWRAHR